MSPRATPSKAPQLIGDRVTTDRYDAPRRHLTRGDEVSVDGIRGRCTFIAHTRHENGNEWVDVIVNRSGRSRTVRPDAIRTAHRR